MRHLRRQGQECIVAGLAENAPGDQPGNRPLADLVPPQGRAFHPVQRIVRLFRADDVGQGGVEHVVIERRRIAEREVVQIGVDAVRQLQVHQHRAREDQVLRTFGHREQRAVLLVQDEQQKLLGGKQHHSSARFSTRSRARSTSRFSKVDAAARIQAPNISGTTAISPHTMT